MSPLSHLKFKLHPADEYLEEADYSAFNKPLLFKTPCCCIGRTHARLGLLIPLRRTLIHQHNLLKACRVFPPVSINVILVASCCCFYQFLSFILNSAETTTKFTFAAFYHLSVSVSVFIWKSSRCALCCMCFVIISLGVSLE